MEFRHSFSNLDSGAITWWIVMFYRYKFSREHKSGCVFNPLAFNLIQGIKTVVFKFYAEIWC